MVSRVRKKKTRQKLEVAAFVKYQAYNLDIELTVPKNDVLFINAESTFCFWDVRDGCGGSKASSCSSLMTSGEDHEYAHAPAHTRIIPHTHPKRERSG